MKRFLCFIASALMLATSAFADEGMWMLPLLQQLNAKAMKDLGCNLTPEDIYSINHNSLKDAIVQFGGGCTGEIISDKGLLVTNHHCGYSSIQKLSSNEHNYLENGFWAMNSKEEIPVPGLSVTFLVSMTDVTNQMKPAFEQGLKEFRDSTVDAREIYAQHCANKAVSGLIEEAKKANPNCIVYVESFYNDNAYYLIVYKRYSDVRFVGAPPASIGKFGGETDNWMWPRHTGDFSMFRVYAGKDNEPATYSEDNVPYVPAQSLKISLKGVNEGDYSMIMGYPGSTQRFQTEAQLKSMMELHDISIEARTLRQSVMWKWMESDPAIRLKYANKYASSANGWKKWIGEKKAFADLEIIEREHQKEEDFTKWIGKNKDRKEKYGSAISDIAESVAAGTQTRKDIQLYGESLHNIEITSIVNNFSRALGTALQAAPGDTTEAIKDALASVKALYDDYNANLDQEVCEKMMEFYRENATADLYPELDNADFANMKFDEFSKSLFKTSVFTSYDKLSKALNEKSLDELSKDPAKVFANSITRCLRKVYLSGIDQSYLAAKGRRDFTAGLLEWNKGTATYPDANFTMRLTYGTVKSYSPKDALNYRYYTTIYGVMEKEDPSNYEFRVPEKLKQLYTKRDYGHYAMKDGNLPTCFLTTNDITGGNSGSPVLNANGELIGLAFDGNWESMSSDVMFEPQLQRCICVDIRYVLFLMDKFGGAGYLLKEMNIEK